MNLPKKLMMLLDIVKVKFERVRNMFRGFGSSSGFYAGINIIQNLAITNIRAISQETEHPNQYMAL